MSHDLLLQMAYYDMDYKWQTWKIRLVLKNIEAVTIYLQRILRV